MHNPPNQLLKRIARAKLELNHTNTVTPHENSVSPEPYQSDNDKNKNEAIINSETNIYPVDPN